MLRRSSLRALQVARTCKAPAFTRAELPLSFHDGIVSSRFIHRNWPRSYSKVVSVSETKLPDKNYGEIQDALRVASLVGSFRSKGHLVALLDPLGRVERGPWLEEVNR